MHTTHFNPLSQYNYLCIGCVHHTHILDGSDVHAQCRASNFTNLFVETRNCTAKYEAWIWSLEIRIVSMCYLPKKMDEFTSTKTESCYTT